MYDFLLVRHCNYSSIQGRRQVKKCGVDTHGERGARAYNGGLGAEPPAESRAETPVRGSGGQSQTEAENLLAFRFNGSSKFASFSVLCKLPKPQVFVINLKKTEGIVHDGMDNTVYQQKKQFGIVLVMCKVATK